MPEHDLAPLPLAAGERWYLVHALPNSERKAFLNLRFQNFRAFVPEINKTISHARRLKSVRRPLFPGYLFVVLDLTRDRWLSVRSTIGVARLVTQADGQPVPVPRGVVETLLSHSINGLVRFDHALKPGQQVRLLSGPFAQLVGKVDRLTDGDRVRVLFELMGAIVPIDVERYVVAPAA